MQFSLIDLPFLAGVNSVDWIDGQTLVITDDGRAFLHLSGDTYEDVSKDFANYREGIALGQYSVLASESGRILLGLGIAGSTPPSEELATTSDRLDVGAYADIVTDQGAKAITVELGQQEDAEHARDLGQTASRLEVGGETIGDIDFLDQSSVIKAGGQDPAQVEPAETSNALTSGEMELRFDPGEQSKGLVAGGQEVRIDRNNQTFAMGSDASPAFHVPFKEVIPFDTAMGGKLHQVRFKEVISGKWNFYGRESSHFAFRPTVDFAGAVSSRESNQVPRKYVVEVSAGLKARDTENSYKPFKESPLAETTVSGGRQEPFKDAADISPTVAYGRQDPAVDTPDLQATVAYGRQDPVVDIPTVAVSVASGRQEPISELPSISASVASGRQEPISEIPSISASVASGRQEPFNEIPSISASIASGRQEVFNEGPKVSAAFIGQSALEDMDPSRSTTSERLINSDTAEVTEGYSRSSEQLTDSDYKAPEVEGVEATKALVNSAYVEKEVENLTAQLGVSSGAVQDNHEWLDADIGLTFVGHDLSAEQTEQNVGLTFVGSPAVEEIMQQSVEIQFAVHPESTEQVSSGHSTAEIAHSLHAEQLTASQGMIGAVNPSNAPEGMSVTVGMQQRPRGFVNHIRFSAEIEDLAALEPMLIVENYDYDGVRHEGVVNHEVLSVGGNGHNNWVDVLRRTGSYTVDSEFAPWPLVTYPPYWYLPTTLTMDATTPEWSMDMDSEDAV